MNVPKVEGSYDGDPGLRRALEERSTEQVIPESLPPPREAGGRSERISACEDLMGGQGREVYFRPTRYRPVDLGPILPTVHVCIGGHVHACAMHDVSQNGVAFAWPPGVPVAVGDVLTELGVTFDDYEAYRGECRVSSVRTENGTQLVGASFVDSLMNIDDVLQLRDVKTWNTEGARGLTIAHKPWYAPGHARFKALVAELSLFLEDAEQEFAKIEASLPWHVVHSDHESAARVALLEFVRAQFVQDFVRVAGEIDAALRAVAAGDGDALRAFSLRQVHRYLMQSPLMYRARHKPLGYPGDFEVMRFIYARHFEGTTLFARAVTLAMASTPAAAAVRSRKDLVRTALAGLLRAHAGDRPVRIASIASGPAEEVYELLARAEGVEAPLDVVLFDQDKGALAYAYGRLKRLVDARFGRRVRITYLHDSIKRLLVDPTIFQGFAPFDAIVCAGLFDYLQLRSAVHLGRSLYGALHAGGTVYIGNMVPANPSRWLMEHHLDWVLNYRTRAEICDFARIAAPDGRVQLLEESTGVNPFVAITRA